MIGPVLVTGGCGFIGSNLLARLTAEGGGPVRILDDLSVGSREALRAATNYREAKGSLAPISDLPKGTVELAIGDICDSRRCEDAARGAETIVHLAANAGVAQSVADPRSDFRVNALGTLNVLEAARRGGARRFVFASSGAPLGRCPPPIHEAIAPRPISPYGASKLAGEAYCSAYFGSYGLETVALRFGNVYGPRSSHKSSVVATFIRRILDDEPLEVFGDGRQTRDFIYTDDLIDAVLRSARAPGVGGELFQISAGRETSVGELCEMLAELAEERGLPRPRLTFADPRVGDVRNNWADARKAASALGWRAKVSLREGLARTLDWFLADAAPRQAAAS